MNRTPLIVKIGGRVLEQPPALKALLKQLQDIQQQRPCVLVHGGGAQVDEMLARLGHQTQKQQGQRSTPAEQMPVIAGVLAGDLNSYLVGLAQQLHLNAIGLTLNAGYSIVCQVDDQRGCVGIPKANEPHFLNQLMAYAYLPIISSIGVAAGDASLRLNVNADLAAAAVAELLDGDLILLTDVPGILDNEGTLLSELSAQQAEQLTLKGIIHGGMQVKLQAAIAAARASRRSIAVAGWEDPTVLALLAKGQAAGTRIYLD